MLRDFKILMLSEYFPPKVMGGGEVSASLLAENLAKAGVKVTVLTSAFPGLQEYEEKEGIRIYRKLKTGTKPESFFSNIKRELFFLSSLKRAVRELCREEDFDVIHCMNMTSLGAVTLKPKIKKPFIAHVNSYLFVCPKGDLWYHGKEICKIHCNYNTFVPCLRDCQDVGKMKVTPWLKYNPIALSNIYARYFHFKQWLHAFDAVVAISTYVQERLAFIGLKKEKVFVLHNILDLEPYLKMAVKGEGKGERNGKGERKGKGEKEKRKIQILYLGNYATFKGPQILLEAVKELQGVACHFYGSGPMELALRAMAVQYPHIRIHGRVAEEQLPELYAKTDIVVFPSLWPEPFGRVPMEAMAAGKAVIASNIAGIRDTVDAKTGILVPPGDVKSLRKALEKLINNPTLRERLGSNGRKEVREKFSGEKIAREMIQTYSAVCRK